MITIKYKKKEEKRIKSNSDNSLFDEVYVREYKRVGLDKLEPIDVIYWRGQVTVADWIRVHSFEVLAAQER